MRSGIVPNALGKATARALRRARRLSSRRARQKRLGRKKHLLRKRAQADGTCMAVRPPDP
eukprot:scaffold38249_cov30-Tisochrysis_lutea.AAC.1